MRFENKVVIVTGSSSGIGASTARSYAKEGAHVVIVGRNEKRLQNVAEDIIKHGKKPLVVKADLSNKEDVKSIVTKTIDTFGKLDILINNAGVAKYYDILDENFPASFDEVMKTNLNGTIQLTRLAAPYLIQSKGNIVNISSVMSTLVTSTKTVCYSISKAALDHFSRFAALELAQSGVRVNIVCPGPVATDFLEHNGSTLTDMERYAPNTMLKRISTPEEVADIILYLSSDQAIGITGATFTIDNGLSVNRTHMSKY